MLNVDAGHIGAGASSRCGSYGSAGFYGSGFATTFEVIPFLRYLDIKNTGIYSIFGLARQM
jgi:hypothetical protein